MDVIFDLDGTLTDPGVGITRCIQHALAVLGRPAPGTNELRRFVGPPLRDAFGELLCSGDEWLITEAVAHYRERFEAFGMFENVVYPDIPDALRDLRRQGHRLWVATSKPEPYARRILEHFNLASCFERIYGSDLSGRNSDKGELLQSVLTQEGLNPSNACMVGDRAHDVLGARQNRVTSVAILWGYGTLEELESVIPDRIVRSTTELREWASCPTTR
jgi:phosphoglycolate phosphatase